MESNPKGYAVHVGLSSVWFDGKHYAAAWRADGCDLAADTFATITNIMGFETPVVLQNDKAKACDVLDAISLVCDKMAASDDLFALTFACHGVAGNSSEGTVTSLLMYDRALDTREVMDVLVRCPCRVFVAALACDGTFLPDPVLASRLKSRGVTLGSATGAQHIWSKGLGFDVPSVNPGFGKVLVLSASERDEHAAPGKKPDQLPPFVESFSKRVGQSSTYDALRQAIDVDITSTPTFGGNQSAKNDPPLKI